MTGTKKDHFKAGKQPGNDHEVYKVGYGKPPLRKKGQCPHRKGPGPRKRGQMEDCRELFDRISNEKIPVYDNDRAIFLTRPQVLARTAVDMGIAGDPECENMLIKIEEPDLTPPAGGASIVEVDSEDEIPARQQELLRSERRPTNTTAPSPARFGRGRPRNDAPVAEFVKRELNKRIKVVENGRTLTMTKREFWIRRLWSDIINGKPRALRLYMKFAKPTEPRGGISVYIIGGR
jgi:hypothetical protein